MACWTNWVGDEFSAAIGNNWARDNPLLSDGVLRGAVTVSYARASLFFSTLGNKNPVQTSLFIILFFFYKTKKEEEEEPLNTNPFLSSLVWWLGTFIFAVIFKPGARPPFSLVPYTPPRRGSLSCCPPISTLVVVDQEEEYLKIYDGSFHFFVFYFISSFFSPPLLLCAVVLVSRLGRQKGGRIWKLRVPECI